MGVTATITMHVMGRMGAGQTLPMNTPSGRVFLSGSAPTYVMGTRVAEPSCTCPRRGSASFAPMSIPPGARTRAASFPRTFASGEKGLLGCKLRSAVCSRSEFLLPKIRACVPGLEFQYLIPIAVIPTAEFIVQAMVFLLLERGRCPSTCHRPIDHLLRSQPRAVGGAASGLRVCCRTEDA